MDQYENEFEYFIQPHALGNREYFQKLIDADSREVLYTDSWITDHFVDYSRRLDSPNHEDSQIPARLMLVK